MLVNSVKTQQNTMGSAQKRILARILALNQVNYTNSQVLKIFYLLLKFALEFGDFSGRCAKFG